MPVFALFFVITVLASVGLPGLNGFVGEYLILLGAFQASPFWAVISVTGVIFGAVYLLTATRKVLFGPVVHDENRTLVDLNAREIGLMVPLVLLCVWIGVQPNAFLSKTEGTLDALQQRIEDARSAEAVGRAWMKPAPMFRRKSNDRLPGHPRRVREACSPPPPRPQRLPCSTLGLGVLIYLVVDLFESLHESTPARLHRDHRRRLRLRALDPVRGSGDRLGPARVTARRRDYRALGLDVPRWNPPRLDLQPRATTARTCRSRRSTTRSS